MGLIEAFNNGKKKHLERNIDSRGKVTRFELPGHYNRLEVIASKAAIAARSPQSRKRRPKALILSVERDRPGSSEEQASAGAFFQRCGYDVIFEKDPDRSSFIEAVRRFRMQQHAEACAVAIMAHGAGGAITSSDGQLIALNQLSACWTPRMHRTWRLYRNTVSCRRAGGRSLHYSPILPSMLQLTMAVCLSQDLSISIGVMQQLLVYLRSGARCSKL